MLVSNLRIENSGADAGWIDLDQMRIFSTDYAAVAALFDEAGTGVDGSILTERQRELIPSVGGFEITGLTMDVPSEQSPGTRIVGGIDAFAMTFDSYVNGIPTDVRSSATNISFVPPDDQSGAMLTSLGLDPFTLSYDLSMHWDRAAQEIVVDNLMVSADNAGTIIISGVLGNAKPQLFSLEPAVAMKAGQALTVKEVHLHVGGCRPPGQGDRDGRGTAERRARSVPRRARSDGPGHGAARPRRHAGFDQGRGRARTPSSTPAATCRSRRCP